MHSKTVLFADDTTVYLVGHNISELQIQMNQDIHELNDWFRANQLSANASKTKFMLLTTRQQALEHEPPHLMFNNEQLECLMLSFLGYILTSTYNGTIIYHTVLNKYPVDFMR